MLDRCYDIFFIPPSLSCCSLACGNMQNNEMLQINAIFEKNHLGTFVHMPLSHRRMERTYVLDRASAQKVYKADKNFCALSMQPIGPFLYLVCSSDCKKN